MPRSLRRALAATAFLHLEPPNPGLRPIESEVLYTHLFLQSSHARTK